MSVVTEKTSRPGHLWQVTQSFLGFWAGQVALTNRLESPSYIWGRPGPRMWETWNHFGLLHQVCVGSRGEIYSVLCEPDFLTFRPLNQALVLFLFWSHPYCVPSVTVLFFRQIKWETGVWNFLEGETVGQYVYFLSLKSDLLTVFYQFRTTLIISHIPIS